MQKIYEENNKIIINFFTEFFFLLSKLILIKEEEFDYKYKIAKNRKGFYFEEFRENFEYFFKNEDFKMMIEFLDILSNDFKKICEDNDTLKPEEVDDNSIEIDKRDSCPICLDFTDEKDVHINDCNHVYHLECLKLQIEKKITLCSLCKRPIKGIKEDPNFKVNPNNNINSTSLFSFNINNNENNIFISLNNRNSPFLPSRQISIFNESPRSIFLFHNINNRNETSNNLVPNRNQTNNLFGNDNPRLFGTRNLFSTNTSSNLFETNNVGTGLFSTSNNNTNTNSIFGNNRNNNSQGGGLFGNNQNNNSQTGGLFGFRNTGNL